jgi:hydrogenase maturation factor
LLAEMLAAGTAPAPEVLVGPTVGEDACALELPAGVLVVATDPITLTDRQLGSYAVVVNANDVAVMGVRPRWFLAVVLLPPGTSEQEVRDLFDEMRGALAGVGAVLVGGHTEVTAAVRQPVVVGQMLGVAESGRFVQTGGARSGDVMVQVGVAPVEGAAVFAAEAPERLHDLDPDLLEAAHRALETPGISVVEAALAACGLGATSLHDPTEGGLAAGLHEMAVAAGVRVRIDRERILWFPPGWAVCEVLGADPWATIASGTLLAAFPPDRADAAVAELQRQGHPAAVIGAVEQGTGVTDAGGAPILWPERDETARLLAG